MTPMTTTFEREYRELDGLTFSVRDNVLLYRVKQPESLAADPVADYLNAHPPKEKPWKLRALIVFGLMVWVWYEVGEYFVRAMR